MLTELHPVVEIKDEQSVDNIHWEDCLLLLKVGRGGVQLAIYKRDSNYFIQLLHYRSASPIKEQDYSEIVGNFLAEKGIRADRCRRVEMLIESPLYTAIPEKFYKAETAADYYHFLYGETRQTEWQTDRIEGHDIRFLYSVDRRFLDYVKKEFSDFSVSHEQGVLLRSIGRRADGEGFYLDLHDRYIFVVVLSKGSPLLIQAYRTEDIMDVVYYVLNVANTLELGTQMNLFLTGFHEESERIIEKISGRFKEVSWLHRPGDFLYPPEIDACPGHYFFHLVSLRLCESLAENSAAGE